MPVLDLLRWASPYVAAEFPERDHDRRLTDDPVPAVDHLAQLGQRLQAVPGVCLAQAFSAFRAARTWSDSGPFDLAVLLLLSLACLPALGVLAVLTSLPLRVLALGRLRLRRSST